MTSSQIITLTVTSFILLLLDFYVASAIASAYNKPPGRTRKRILAGYWFITLLTLGGMLIGIFFSIGRMLRTIIYVWFFMNYLTKLFLTPFIMLDDIRRVFKWLFKKGRKPSSKKLATDPVPVLEGSMSRSQFLVKSGLVVASIPFAAMNIGLISGAYDYRIRRRTLYLPNLPAAFDGLKLGQISDIHAGSFYNKTAVQGGIDMLNAEKPDLIFFTGDLVNDETAEMKNYMNVFDKLKAPLGIFSVLGNHDYGDYKPWPSEAAKRRNLEDLILVHKNLGWNLLMNENHIVGVDNEKLAILGIENWGAMGRFPKKGRVDLALKGAEDAPVKLLLSHDPSHWEAEVLPKYAEVDAMFAGHTHGMQFGIQFGDFQWSPVQYFYPQWSGLYRKGHQQLYVNVGYGFLGYPGRFGILPEITIFELKKGQIS